MSDSGSVFAPKGLQQSEAQASAGPSGRSSVFAPRASGEGTNPQDPFAPRNWYTGANMQGTENGYDTPFFKTFFEQQTQASKDGTLNRFFERPDATGIVTYDHGRIGDPSDTDKPVAYRFRFGDVYDGGKKVGNIYDTYKDSPRTADLLMADLTLGDDEKAHAFKDRNNPERVSEDVAKRRRTTEVEVGKWETQQAYQGDVAKQDQAFRENGGEAVTVAGGIAGGAGTGAGAGAALTAWLGPGAAIGAVVGGAIGAVVGGVGAYLNQDEILDQAARAKVQQDMASKEFGATAGALQGLQGWSGVAMKSLSPLGNLTHGIYDEAKGDVGDTKSEFYARDDQGNAKRSGWMTATDLVAGVGDSMLQFASPLGRIAYATSMTGNITGQLGELTASGGSTFDDRSGRFDSIFTNDKGEFDAGAAAAGIGNIGIDIVQLGMARGLGGVANSARRLAGAGVEGATAKPIIEGGFKYTLDEAGVATSRRISVSFLAPSEMVKNASASWMARRAVAAADGATVKADDIYRAVGELSTGERRVAAALVNGFGEGSEEGLQAILEPISHGSSADWAEIGQAALQGFAMGTGMSLGTRIGGPTNDDRQYARALVNHYQRTGEVLERDTYNGWDKGSRANAAAGSDLSMGVAKHAALNLERAQRTDQAAAIPMIDKVENAMRRQQDKELGSLNPRLDGAYRITAATSASQLNHAVTASMTQVQDLLDAKADGLQIQLDNAIQTPLEDPAAQDQRIEDLQLTAQEVTTIQDAIDASATALGDAVDNDDHAAARDVVHTLNNWLSDAYSMNQEGIPQDQALARAKAASLLFVRDPQDQSGSYQVLLPQVSYELTRMDANNGLEISLAVLQAIGGDFDGDKIRSQQVLELNDEGFRNLRAGMNLLGNLGSAGTGVNIATRAYEEHSINEMSRALQLPAASALRTGALDQLNQIHDALVNRYDGLYDQINVTDLNELFAVFENAVYDGNTKARELMLSAFAQKFGSVLATRGRDQLTNEWYWMDQVVQEALQGYQTIHASNTDRQGELHVGPVQPVRQTADVREFRQVNAVSPGMTLAQKADGDSIFRMFQKLHYSKWLAPVVQDGSRTESVRLQDLIGFYEQLNTGVTRSALDELNARDEVTGRVLFQLLSLAGQAKLDTKAGLNANLAAVQLAFAQVPDVTWSLDGKEEVVLSTDRSMLQVLLRRSIEMDRNEHAANATPEMESRWAALDSLVRDHTTASKAFVEVFGQVSLYDLIGSAADSMGRNRSVEQMVRLLNAQSETGRAQSKKDLRAAPEYTGDSRANPPYVFTEAKGFPVTAYQAVVDAMLSTSARRLSVDGDGLTTGDLGDTGPRNGGTKHSVTGASYRTHEALTEGLELVKRSFLEFTGWRKLDGKSPAAIAAVMRENPQWAKAALDLVPDAAVNAVYDVRDGQLFVSNWVYEMLSMNDVQAAAMHYWRNVMLARWNAKGVDTTGEGKNMARSYDQLTDRFHRLMFRLRREDDNGTRLTQFLTDLESADDVRQFMRVINTKYRINEAPYTAWVSDAAEFDADKAGGGLVKDLESGLLRVAIGEFKDRSQQLLDSISEERRADLADAATMNQLADDLKAERAGSGTSVKLAQLRKQLHFAKQLAPTLGPDAMTHMTTVAAIGVYDSAHDKGKSPSHVTPLGELQSLGGGPGRFTSLELWTAAMTSHDAAALGQDLHSGLLDTLDGMDESGRPFIWDQLDDATVIEMYQTNASSRPAIRAMLFPSVYERTESGSIVQQFLTGKSITSLLEGSEYLDYVTSYAPSAKKLYAAMLDSLATQKGASFAFMRAADDIVIAQMSKSGRVLTVDDIARNTDKVYGEMTDILRMVGELASQPDPDGILASNFATLRNNLRDKLASNRLAQLFKLTPEEKASNVGDVLIAEILTRAETEKNEEITTLLADGTAESAFAAAAVQNDFDINKARLEDLQSDNSFKELARRYQIPADPQAAAEVKQEILRYARTNPTLLQRTPWAEPELRDLYQQLLSPSYPGDLPVLYSEESWQVLSRAVIAGHISDNIGWSASRIAMPEYPEASKTAEARYWDKTWLYLVEPFIDLKAPLVEAARDMHLEAGVTENKVRFDQLEFKILETILSSDRLGDWTPDIPQQSVSTNKRIDSSGVEAAISSSGQSPKNQAALSAATRRRYTLPPENLVSNLSLAGSDLVGNDATTSVPTSINTEAGSIDVELPLLALNGRFARNVAVTYQGRPVTQTQLTDTGASVEQPNLLYFQGPETGMLYDQVQEYQAITVKRLIAGIQNAIQLPVGQEIDWSQVAVSLEYLHPESQPATAEHANSIYFEGVSFEIVADTYDSLNAGLYFAPGGENPDNQAAALQAQKKGTLALLLKTAPRRERKKALEVNWSTDLGKVLREKARLLTISNTGRGRLPGHYFNSQLKSMKMRHWVRGFDENGNPVLLSAEQVIAAQHAAPGQPLALAKAELYIPSDRVLRTMLGEIGPQGLPGSDEIGVDLSQITTYDGSTESIVTRVPAILEIVRDSAGEPILDENGAPTFSTTKLMDTSAGGRTRQTQWKARPPLGTKLRTEYQRGVMFLQQRREKIHQERQNFERDKSTMEANSKKAMAFIDTALSNMTATVDFPSMGIPYPGLRSAGDLEVSKRLVAQLGQELLLNDWSAAWIYRHGGTEGPAAGELTAATLDKSGKKVTRLALAMGDLVGVDVASFITAGHTHARALSDGQRVMELLVGQRVNIVLPDGHTGGDLRAELGQHLRSLGYEKLNGSEHVYTPRDDERSVSQNIRSRRSSLSEVRGISANSVVATLLLPDIDIGENAAFITEDAKHREVAVAVDLLQNSALGRFNLPVGEDQVSKTRQMVQTMLDHDVQFLADLQGIEAPELERSLRKLVDSWAADPENAGILPRSGEFGIGDIIPLFSEDLTRQTNGSLLLLRHGFQPPDIGDVRRMQMTPRTAGETLGFNVAVAGPKRQPSHTVHTGQIRRFVSRGNNGLGVELAMELQTYLDKVVLEGSGMKYLLTPMDTSKVRLPSNPMFEGWPIDFVASIQDNDSKESSTGVIKDFRNAFAFLGIDFMPDLVKFFGVSEVSVNQFLLTVASRAPRLSVEKVDEILRAASFSQSAIDMQARFTAAGVDTSSLQQSWHEEIEATSPSPESSIAFAVLMYLQTPGARLGDVIASGGFNNPDSRSSNKLSVLMPPLFTDFFGRTDLDSELRKHLFEKLNRQFNNPTKDEGYHLTRAFDLILTNKDSRFNRTGRLQFAEMHSTGDNPLTDGMAHDRALNQQVSYHSGAIASMGVGGITASAKGLVKTARFRSRAGVESFEEPGGLWRMISDIPEGPLPSSLQLLNPAQQTYKIAAYDEVGTYREQLDQSNWEDVEKNAGKRYERKRLEVARLYGLASNQSVLVDGWIRQLLGRPLSKDGFGRLSFAEAMEGLREIEGNAVNGYLPVYGGEVQRLSLSDLTAIFRANQGDSARFRMRQGPNSTDFVTSWDDWTKVALGVGQGDKLFDFMYLLALDGFTHTYLDAGDNYLGLPVSSHVLLDLKLMTEDGTGRPLSLDPNRELTLAEAPLYEGQQILLDDFTTGQGFAGRSRGRHAPASELAKRRAARKRWRKDNNIPEPVVVNARDFRAQGAAIVEEAPTQNALLRNITNLRVANALLNPALYVSAFFETGVRGALEDVTNVLTGDSLGAGGKLAAWAASHTPDSLKTLTDTLGFAPRYTPEQVAKFRSVSHTLASRHDFRSMIYNELAFQAPKRFNAGLIERGTSALAKLGAMSQDPTYGMRADVLSRRYIEAVMSSLSTTPTLNTVTPDYIAAQLALNPTWIKDHLPDVHKQAVATIASVRSLKPTPVQLALRGIYEPLSQNPNAFVSVPSTLVLKLPLMFSGYAANVATTMLGLQGWSSLLAMHLDGKRNPASRLTAALAGKPYNESADNTFDMSSVLEGVDLTKAFIQSGVSLTSLFAFGMVAGGLGLSGEDDEDRRRRRAAKMQGAGYVYDPRSLENDFRNSEAVFLENLPFGLSSLLAPFTGVITDSDGGRRQMAQPHWMLKQFLSPIMGISRFFETGDPRQITWGFQDGLSSFPLINQAMWDDATKVYSDLSAAALTHEAEGSAKSLVAAQNLWNTAVMVYERMLFENSFVNMLYMGYDDYDRDPFAIPEVDSDGVIQRDRMGTPRPTKALDDFVDPVTGEVRSGYVKNDSASATAHAYSENRFGVALFMSLFSGFNDSDYFRQNMVVKTRTVEKPALSQSEAESLVLSIWNTELGHEELTIEGATGIFTGLYKGSVKLGDPSLEGVFIPLEMRKAIQAKWMTDLISEGLSMGLTESKAKSRMKEIWYGSLTDPNSIGLGDDILFKKGAGSIPYTRDLRYFQLNTTYVQGPDGMPWATGVTRGKLMSGLGLQPVNRYYAGETGNLDVDSRLNSTDKVNGINLGLRALTRADESWLVPTDEEIGQAIEKAVADAMGKDASSFTPYPPYSKGGYRKFGRRSYGGRRGGGGYGSGGGGGYGSKLNPPQDNQTPYGNTIPFINTSNPIIRRATIRRERFDSDRGRLNQWQ